MRTTKNITLAISEELYRRARIYVVRRGMSLSNAVGYLLDHLPAVDQAVRKLAEDPDFGSPGGSSVSVSNGQKSGRETVKQEKIIENKKVDSEEAAASQNP